MEDIQIIELYWMRDEAAIRETDVKYGTFCHRVAMNILHSFQDSEECVSDTYGRCWDTMPPQRPGSLRAYLGTIIRNLSISRYRSAHAQKRFGGVEVLLSELTDCVPSPESVQRTVEDVDFFVFHQANARIIELGELISRWLEGLPEEDRALFIRRYWNGDAVKTLAGELGARPNAVTKRLLRLREALRKNLEEQGVCV